LDQDALDAERGGGFLRTESSTTLPAAMRPILAPTTDGDGNGAGPGRREEELDPALLAPGPVADDRRELEDDDRIVLIVEDDADFAKIELEMARESGFKGLVALRG